MHYVASLYQNMWYEHENYGDNAIRPFKYGFSLDDTLSIIFALSALMGQKWNMFDQRVKDYLLPSVSLVDDYDWPDLLLDKQKEAKRQLGNLEKVSIFCLFYKIQFFLSSYSKSTYYE